MSTTLHPISANFGAHSFETIDPAEKRAKSVYNYLSKKVNKNQLKFKGYGERVPIEDNSTFDGRKSNRRTSFIIL